MRFSEHEMTMALTGAAKTVAAAQRRAADPEAAWAAMSRIEQYHALTALSDQVLPALAALPEVEVPSGSRPTFTDPQVEQAVLSTLGDAGGWLRKKATIAARTSLLKIALASLPVRRDPDAFVVPDFL